MPRALVRPKLHVEGDDDFHAIIHLLLRHGVDYDSKPWPPEFPKVIPVGSVESLLDGMEVAVKVSSDRPVGFVLDVDTSLRSRWDAVKARLERVDVEVPEEPLPGGFIGTSASYKTRVGVWLMPDNQQEGKLEDFLRDLIDENDPLIEHATSSVDAASGLGAEFTDPDRIKAIIHTWLAWQEEPGLPYGTAIRAKFFRHDSEVAVTFVEWFKALYEIS